MKTHHNVIIIGGGTAGIMTAAQMLKKRPTLDVAILDPADSHFYQAAWTLVGANTYSYKDTARPMRSVIPKGAAWIKEAVTQLNPEKNTLSTGAGKEYSYDYLVVAPGLVMRPDLVEGLEEAMKEGVVCSNYTNPEHTWETLNSFTGGTALFLTPNTPIKCGGAPQKIMYLAADLFRKRGIAKKTRIAFATPGTIIFGVPEIARTLQKVVDRNNINVRYGYNWVGIDAKEKIAWFELMPHEKEHNHLDLEEIVDGKRKGIRFDMLHMAPPQSAPDFIRSSSLANEGGWLNVDKGTLQHKTYSNVFGLGDVAALPTAKTGAAVRKQVPVVVENLFRMLDRKELAEKKYNGYSSCPLVTAYGKMVLAEFDYENKFIPDPKLKQMLVFDSSKESWRLWILKKYILPFLYWNKMLKGKEV